LTYATIKSMIDFAVALVETLDEMFPYYTDDEIKYYAVKGCIEYGRE
jgi:hypothetical protein